MHRETANKRAVSFIDGQNLFRHAKDAFGYYHPNYDPYKRMTLQRPVTSALILLLAPIALSASVVTDRFTLQWEIEGANLLLAIDTDLPDITEVIVSVERLYYEVGNDSAYSRSYFEEKGRLLEWRDPRRIPIDDEAWKGDLRAHQEGMAKLGSPIAFEIGRIEDQIQVNAVVHINQPAPVFGGHGNPNLSGAAVHQSGNRNLIRRRENIDWPLTGAPVPKESKRVAYDGLKQGESYRLLNEIPLMAVHPRIFDDSDDLDQRMETLGKTIYVPAGRSVRVIEVISPDSGGTTWPWYQIDVIGSEGTRGWINSAALMSNGVERE